MSAETVTNKIEEKARAAAETIIAEAKQKAESDRLTITNDAAERVKKLLEQAAVNADVAEKGRARADALNTKLAVLDLKRELLLAARNEAKEKLVSMNDKSFTDIFTKYLKASELNGEFTVIPSQTHRDLCKNNLKALSDNTGLKLTLSEENATLDSGFLLSSKNYDVEFSVDALLDDVFENNEKLIADILFETGDVE